VVTARPAGHELAARDRSGGRGRRLASWDCSPWMTGVGPVERLTEGKALQRSASTRYRRSSGEARRWAARMSSSSRRT
jgi:hypothetical protein